ETDRFPADAGGEGSPIKLAEKRTSTFKRKKKIFRNSTPVYKGASPIEAFFELTDKRYYFVPCPHCDSSQVLKWDRIRWTKDDRGRPISASVHYLCAFCEKPIREGHKTRMLERGEWRGTAPAVDGEKSSAFTSRNSTRPTAGLHGPRQP